MNEKGVFYSQYLVSRPDIRKRRDESQFTRSFKVVFEDVSEDDSSGSNYLY